MIENRKTKGSREKGYIFDFVKRRDFDNLCVCVRVCVFMYVRMCVCQMEGTTNHQSTKSNKTKGTRRF